jgi:hypothetical protein
MSSAVNPPAKGLAPEVAAYLVDEGNSGSSERCYIATSLNEIASNGEESAQTQFLVVCADEMMKAARAFIDRFKVKSKRPAPAAAPGLYKLEFTEEQWQELISLSFEPFEFGEGDELTRGQWMALAHMCVGKAERVKRGDYGPANDVEPFDPEQWAEDLESIANTILNEFQPGDGKI